MFVVFLTLEYGDRIEADFASGNTKRTAEAAGAALARQYELEGATVTMGRVERES
jgi:hypothetical protein